MAQDGNVIKPIPGFMGGVSQQSPVLRLDTQSDISVNTHMTVDEGLMQRPNGDFIKLLGTLASSSGWFVHKVVRDKNEKYLVVLCNNATNPIYVFDLAGNQKTINYGHLDADLNFTADNTVKTYLTASITDCRTQLKAVSIADYTIILNTQKVTAMTAAKSGGRDDIAFLYVKKINPTGCYSVTLKWTESGVSQTFTKESPRWEVGAELDTDSITNWFYTEATHAKFDIATAENMVWWVPKAGSGVDAGSLSITCSDPLGNTALIPISQCQVDKVSDLPPRMPENIKMKIGGNRDEAQDDYYLDYDELTHTWVEGLGWEVPYELDATTLPHRLVRMEDGTFVFGPIIWEDREVGDEDTSLTPSFVGSTINNLRFHKNRLWFFADDNSIGSKASDYFNYFCSTVMDVLDDDPIDVSGTGEQVVNLRSAKGFDKGLLLFSDEQQFVLTSGDQAFTPSSVSIDDTTDLPADDTCDPVKLGPDVYFVCPKGSYLSLRQYTIMPDTLIQDAYDVTAHVPKYIPKGTSAMLSGCNQLDMLFLWSEAEQDVLYVHKFLYDGNTKVQQAWYKWSFDCDIIGFKVFGTLLYVIFNDATNGKRLECINLETVAYSGEPFRYHLDTLMKVTGGVYSSPSTTFTLPVNVGTDEWMVVEYGTGVEIDSNLYTLSGTSLVVTGDVHTKTYFVGRRYEARHRLSEWYMRDTDGRAIVAGNLQIKSLTLSFINTGYFEVQVQALGRDPMVAQEMTGLRVGETAIGGVAMLSGEKTFEILADSKFTQVDIVTDTYLPIFIQTGSWRGTFALKGRVV